MVQMVGWEIAGQDFAVKAIDRMNVRRMAASTGSAGLRDQPVVIDQHRFVTVPQSPRLVANVFESEAGQWLRSNSRRPRQRNEGSPHCQPH
jgi:hypothetical protein